MPTEVEAKFLAADAAPLERLETASRLGDARLGPIVVADELDRYLDTAAGHLTEARWACRLRERQGSIRVSLKGPPIAVDTNRPWLHRRPEVEGPATEELHPRAWPASEARDQLVRLSGGAALVEQLCLRQRRGERPVVLDGERIGTLSLDHCEVETDAGRVGILYVVELELAAGAGRDEAALDRIAEALAISPGLEPEPRTKYEHALAMRATAA
ncbi:MAG: CYTH domain-containing protein [Candidatus Limnocylindria bacterium]